MKIYSVLGNTQKLDGGSMFGNAPKALWTRWCAADKFNRIDLSCRALLIDTGEKVILFEVGIGAFFEPKLKEIYGVQEDEHVLLNSLKSLGYTQENITDIVLSHLHFDHAGGLLTPYSENNDATLLFPNAHYIIGKKAFERAENPHIRDRASYIPELPLLLKKSNRLEIIADSANHSLKNLVTFRFSDGHTPGLMISEIHHKSGNIFFVSDLIPATPWVHLPITMGYDRFPELLINEKQKLLEECVTEKKKLFYTHDSKFALSAIEKDERGRFKAINPLKEISFNED